MAESEQPNREHTDAAVIEQFRRIYGAVGNTARADQTMLGLWFTVLTGRPAAALVAYRHLVDDYLPWVERRLLGRSRQAVQQRHDRTWNVAELSPPAAQSSRNVIEKRQIKSALADRRRRSAADEADRRNGLVAW